MYDARRQGRPVSTQFLGVNAPSNARPPLGRMAPGRVKYWDGQFDDARLALALARTAAAGRPAGQLLPRQEAGGMKVGVTGFECEDAEPAAPDHCAGPLRGECHWRVGGWAAPNGWRPSASPSNPWLPPARRAHRGGIGNFAIRPRADGAKTADGRVPFCRALQAKSFGTTDSPRQDVVREPLPFKGRSSLHPERICTLSIARAQAGRHSQIWVDCVPWSNRRMKMAVTPRASAANTPCWPAAVAWSP